MADKVPWYAPLLNWLKDVIPTSIALLMAVFNYMRGLVQREKNKRKKAEVEREFLQNEIDVHKKFGDLSDRELIEHAVNKGRQLQDEAKPTGDSDSGDD